MNKKKKIVIVSPAHPLRGGIAALTERLAKELQKGPCEVTIVSFRLQYPGFLFPGKTQYSTDPPPAGLDIKSWINSVNPVNWILTGLKIRKLKPDLIVVRYWLPFMGPCLGTVLRIAKRRKTKVIAITDNVLPHEKRPGDKLFTRYFIGAADAFITMSESVEQDLRLFTRNKPSRLIPHPVYDNYGTPASRQEALGKLGLPPDGKYVLFFGFIRDYKGLDLLLRALADKRLKAMEVRLIVAGEYYGNREKYEQLIAELDLQERVILHTDYIPNADVRYYFGAADLVAQPYKSATQSGISQMAYHFEKPMLVTAVGGLPEIVAHGKAGYVVEVSPKAIANAIVDFFEKERQQAFTEGVREEKKRFSWQRLVEGLEELAGWQ